MGIFSWVEPASTNVQANLRLFCFPYAGGGSLIFRSWGMTLPKWIEVCPVELPGRGRLLHQPAITQMEQLVCAVASSLSTFLDRPFAFFGHSLGAFIAFELARQVRSRYQKEPVYLFVSGNKAPDLPSTRPVTYNLPEAEFRAELARLNGTSPEILENPEAMSLVTPLLRADFEIIETYVYQDGSPLSCPIRAFGGLQDMDATMDDMSEWAHHTTSSFSLSMLPGDHFFLRKSEQQLLSVLAADLEWITCHEHA
jgi:medium-chain acyl-[acyl-carrier-protein] hydrolase